MAKVSDMIALPSDTPRWAIALYDGLANHINKSTSELSEKIGVIEQTIKQIDLRTTTLESRSETHSSNIADLQTKYTYQDLEIEALKDQNASIERQLNTLQKQNKSLQDQAVVQVTQNKILHDKFLYQENHSRRMNLIFHGFKESAWETETQSEAIVRNYMHDTLKVDSTTFMFDSIHRVGPRILNSKRARTILVRFSSHTDRQTVWKARQPATGNDLFVTQDFPVEIQQRRRTLIPILNAAKTLDEYKAKSYIYNDKLVINGTTYTSDNLSTLPAELDPSKIATPTKSGYTFFWGRQSPLSNHYPCEFIINDTTYNCTEQYYMHQKASFARDFSIARDILASRDPVEQLKLGRRLVMQPDDKDKWLTSSNEVMARGLSAKFDQNPSLHDFLVATGDTELVEASPHDTYWGIGLSIRSPLITDKASWKGKNKLGNLMVHLRDSWKSL
jgi:ribA/ribD-fused uncharacterized protein